MKKIINVCITLVMLSFHMNTFFANENLNNNGMASEKAMTCVIGVSTIEECFTDTVWAHAVAKKIGAANIGTWTPAGSVTAIPEYDINTVLTTAMVESVTEINGNNDVAPFIYKDSANIAYMPKMDGLGLFPNLKKITTFGSSSAPFGNVTGWTNEGITDFSNWNEATELTEISLLNFSNGKLTEIDLGNWGDLSKLEKISDIYFYSNQLTTIGNIGNWGQITTLKSIETLNFSKNALINIGDLGNWKNAVNLTKIYNLDFSTNQLETIGDLGEWESLQKLTQIYLLEFYSNKLTDIGDLGRWGNIPTLLEIDRVGFRSNLLTDIGNLGNWGNIPNLRMIRGLVFSDNKLTNIGDLSEWKNATKLTTIGGSANYRLDFSRNALTTIGDIGEWGEITGLKTLFYLEFSSNQLTYIGDLGKWGKLVNLTEFGTYRFNNNQLVDIGDLGEWGNLSNIRGIQYVEFGNNKLTNIGDISNWKNLTNITYLANISFYNNELTSIGKIEDWKYLTKLTTFYSFGFSNNKLTDVGDLGEWETLPNVTYFTSVGFANNQLTDVGDLGRWGNINTRVFSSIDFSDNQLTDVGDLGNWGKLTTITTLNNIKFNNNNLSDIGDLGQWSNLVNLQELHTIEFINNELTTIGDLSLWNKFTKLKTATIYSVDFSGNHIDIITMDDEFINKGVITLYSQKAFYFREQTYQKELIYANKYGLNTGATTFAKAPVHNPFNSDDGTYGTYTLTPDALESYKDMTGNTLTIDNKTFALPVKVGENTTSYSVEQLAKKYSIYQRFSMNYQATVEHPVAWIELGVDAADFSIKLQDISSTLTDDMDAITEATTSVHLVDEFGATQDVIATVDSVEYNAIKNTSVTGSFPLTFSYEYQGITVSKTIQVTVYETDLAIEATDFSIALTDVAALSADLAKTNASVSATNITTNTDITPQVTVDNTQLSAIQNTTVTGTFLLTFSVSDDGITKTVTIEVTVYRNPDVLLINASDFSIELSDTSELTTTLAKELANVTARNVTEDKDITPLVTLDETELATIQLTTEVGIFPLTFIVTENGVTEAITIAVTVYKNPDVIKIEATDFAIKLTDVSDLTEVSAKDNANVLAKNITENTDITSQVTVDIGELSVIQSTTEAGVFPLTFTIIDNGITETITINVTVIEEVDKLSIDATDFSINLNDVENLTEIQAKISASVSAKNVTKNKDITSQVVVNTIELEMIQRTKEADIFPLTFTVTDNGVTETVTINVTVYAVPDAIEINATDFTMNLEDVGLLTKTEAMVKAVVSAKNITDDKDISQQVEIDATELTAIQSTTEVGIYPLTFTVTDNGVTKTITINVTVVKSAYEYSIVANDAVMEIADFNMKKKDGTLAKAIIEITKARAFNDTLNVEVGPIEVDLDNFESANIVNGTMVEVYFTYNISEMNSNVSVDKINQISTKAIITLIDNNDIDVSSNNNDSENKDLELVATGEAQDIKIFSGILLFVISGLGVVAFIRKRKLK